MNSEQDKLIFKTVPALIFTEIETKCKVNILGVKHTNYDTEYGINIIHFHIKQCPNWLFGLWLTPDENGTSVGCNFFAQYEKNIDKFKPSASCISCNQTYCEGDEWGFPEIISNVSFIKNNPMLAFYRDYHFADFNTEYVSKFKATYTFIDYNTKTFYSNVITSLFNNIILNYVKKNILPLYNNAFIDEEPNCFPQYQISIPFVDNKEYFDTPGWYDLSPEESDKLYKLEKKLSKISKTLKVCWYSPLWDMLVVLDPTKLPFENDSNDNW